MKHFFQRFVTIYPPLGRKLAHLRTGLLIALCACAVGLALAPQSVPADAPAEAPLRGLTVALDPGHGGPDGGARAQDSGLWEEEIALEIALAVERELLSRGAQVVLTRREDACLQSAKRADLLARRELAENAGADVLLSIHLNEYRDRSESGPQVFYQRGADAGRLLAGCLQESLVSALQPRRVRKAAPGDYYVLRGKLPSALVECGFLSNPGEERLLLTDEYRQRIARAVADGLEQWMQLR